MSDVTARHRELGHIFADIYRDNEDANHNDIGLRIAAKLATLEGDPPQGLEDAVRECVVGIFEDPTDLASIGEDDIVERYTARIIAAVQPLLDELQAKVQEHRNHVAKIMSSSHIESRRHIEARRELHAKVDALEKQIKHQREIHESNQAAFDNIHNEAHEKIAQLQADNDRLKRLVKEAHDE